RRLHQDETALDHLGLELRQTGESALAEIVLGPEGEIGLLLHLLERPVEIVEIDGHAATPPGDVLRLRGIEAGCDVVPGKAFGGKRHVSLLCVWRSVSPDHSRRKWRWFRIIVAHNAISVLQ